MPRIGEKKRGSLIGMSTRSYFVWLACTDCGKERWVGSRQSPRCVPCAARNRARWCIGDKSGKWKGGRLKTKAGYVLVIIQPDSFYFPMASYARYIPEHRLVMAQHLCRCLLPWEVVHHKNGVKDDNRLENLELLPSSKQHLPSVIWSLEIAKRDKKIAELEERVTLLEAELVLLKQTDGVA